MPEQCVLQAWPYPHPYGRSRYSAEQPNVVPKPSCPCVSRSTTTTPLFKLSKIGPSLNRKVALAASILEEVLRDIDPKSPAASKLRKIITTLDNLDVAWRSGFNGSRRLGKVSEWGRTRCLPGSDANHSGARPTLV